MMKNVLLLLAQGFEEYEASVFTDVLGWSRDIGDIPVNVTTAGRRSHIKCTWNFTVIPETQVNEIIFDNFLNIIRQFHETNKIIASICVGALPLGKSGILKNKKATTYHLLNGIRRKQLESFGANVQDQPIVVDDNIITSTSPATALEVSFMLLEMLTSKDNLRKVKTAMGFV